MLLKVDVSSGSFLRVMRHSSPHWGKRTCAGRGTTSAPSVASRATGFGLLRLPVQYSSGPSGSTLIVGSVGDGFVRARFIIVIEVSPRTGTYMRRFALAGSII